MRLELTDDYKIFDQLMEKQRQNPKCGPLGWVKAFMQNKSELKRKLFFEGPNMVVAQGRYFVAQRIFNVADTSVNYTNFVISHFAVGAGGATVDGDAVTLLGPSICDVGLYKPIGLESTHNEPVIYDNGALTPELQQLYTSYGSVKPINTLTLVAEDYDETATTCTYKTKVKCECVVGPGEPPALAINGYVPISEAGLYFVSGDVAKMFAHVCFKKWKANKINIKN